MYLPIDWRNQNQLASPRDILLKNKFVPKVVRRSECFLVSNHDERFLNYDNKKLHYKSV